MAIFLKLLSLSISNILRTLLSEFKISIDDICRPCIGQGDNAQKYQSCGNEGESFLLNMTVGSIRTVMWRSFLCSLLAATSQFCLLIALKMQLTCSENGNDMRHAKRHRLRSSRLKLRPIARPKLLKGGFSFSAI